LITIINPPPPPIAFILILATPQSMSFLAGAHLDCTLNTPLNNFLLP
jgi:hypothetical protein